jgi:hypothetical protein
LGVANTRRPVVAEGYNLLMALRVVGYNHLPPVGYSRPMVVEYILLMALMARIAAVGYNHLLPAE